MLTAKQKRGQETIDMVLAETAKVLADQGEGKVRIQEIANSTGVSIGSIYHHFGNREGLILEAYVHNFTSGFGKDLMSLIDWLDGVTEVRQLTEDTSMMRTLFNSHWSNERPFERISILGSLAGRSDLQAAITEVHSKLIDSLVVSIERLQSLGFVKNNVPARAIALTAVGISVGRVLTRIDSVGVTNDDWNQVTLELLSGLIPFELMASQVAQRA